MLILQDYVLLLAKHLPVDSMYLDGTAKFQHVTCKKYPTVHRRSGSGGQ